MTDQQYTPTLDSALDEIATILARFRSSKESIRAELDQLIAQVESAAEQRGAIKVLLRAEKLLEEDRAELGEEVKVDVILRWLRYLATGSTDYRADRIANKENE